MKSIESMFWFNFNFTKEELINDSKTHISDCLVDTEYLNRLKNEIGNFYNVGFKNNPWNSVSLKLYPYKDCYSSRKISRANYKLKEIAALLKSRYTKNFFKNKEILCLCEAPGGFVEYLIEEENATCTAISLGGDISFCYKLVSNKKCKIHYKNLLLDEISLGKFSIITADGGVDSSNDYKLQEQNNLPLILKEVEVACKHLNKNGILIIKIFDIHLLTSFGIIIWLSKMFKEISVCKPPSSKPTNSEKYVICKFFHGNQTFIPFDQININFIPNKLCNITLFSTQLQINNIKKVLAELYIPTKTNWNIKHKESKEKYNYLFKL